MPIDTRSSPSSQSRATFSWFLLIGANILWATSYVAGKLALSGGTSSIFVLALRMSISTLILLPLLIAKRKEIKLSRQDLPQLALLACIGFVVNKLFEFGGLALIVTVIAYLAWFQGLAKVDASVAASTLFIQPLLGTLLAIILLHDQLTSMTIVGGLLIIISVYVISKL